MISEGSCDTEDWSNDAEKFSLITEINYVLKYIQNRKVILNSKNISKCTVFAETLDQINQALVSRRDFFKKDLTVQKLFDWYMSGLYYFIALAIQFCMLLFKWIM